ncbi:MAG: HD domain-containing protein [Aeoliella sp.]
MPHDFLSLPELSARYVSSGLVRLPPGDDVPITPRIRRLIDTSAMRRLSQVSQLGLVRLVYPGAGHSRFEHSLGVYRVALDFLARLAGDERFANAVSPAEAEQFIAAALLHDVGHWPYCHPLEDIRLRGLTNHEALAREAITSGPIADALSEDWDTDPAHVANLVAGVAHTPGEKIICSMLSGPVDVDKIDYLARDSLHAGVPYGRNFDQQRLIASLCLNEAGDAIAVTDKGKTAAELMVFARYVMFSEVYWHHAVRSATAMLQRAAYSLRDQLDWKLLYETTNEQFAQHLNQIGEGTGSADLVAGLFGSERTLYKRLAQYSLFESPELYEKLARRPYAWLVGCAERFAELAARETGESIAPQEILFDAPPIKLEVQFNVEVYATKQDCHRPLGEVSPVVRTLAQEQFDDYVKRVRVFIHPRLVERLETIDVNDMVAKAIDA